MGRHQDCEAAMLYRVRKGLHNLAKDCVINCGHDQADGSGAFAMHGLGRAIADVAQTFNRLINAFTGGKADKIGVIETARNGRNGNFGGFCHGMNIDLRSLISHALSPIYENICKTIFIA